MRSLYSFKDVLMNRLGYDVFISYKSSESKQYAANLCYELRGKYRVFLDDRELYAGDSLPDTLKNKLSRSTILIVIAGPLASSSEWVNLEINYYLENRKRPLIVPIFFKGISLSVTEAFTKLELFKGTYELLENLRPGTISETVTADISASIGRLTKTRIAQIITSVALILLITAAAFVYFINRSNRYDQWVERGQAYLEQFKPDFAEMAFTYAATYKNRPDTVLLQLYQKARAFRILEPYARIEHSVGELCLHIAEIAGHPAMVMAAQGDSAFFLEYRKTRTKLKIPGNPALVSSDSLSILFHTDDGIYDLEVKDKIRVLKISSVNPDQVSRIFKHKGDIITLWNHDNTLEVIRYQGRAPYAVKESRTYVIPVSRTINEYIYNPETKQIAVLSTDHENSRLHFYCWSGVTDQPPKTDIIPLTPLAIVGAFSASDNYKTFSYITWDYDYSFLVRSASSKLTILEPEDPYRSMIVIEGVFSFLENLNDRKNYVSYLTDTKDLTIIPRFDYILNQPQPRTLVTNVDGYKLLKNDSGGIIMLAVKDFITHITDDQQLMATYAVSNQRINSVTVSSNAGFVAMDTDSVLYIWKRAKNILPAKVPTPDQLEKEIGLDLKTGEYAKFKSRSKSP